MEKNKKRKKGKGTKNKIIQDWFCLIDLKKSLMGGWMDGWMGWCLSFLNDSLQQLKILITFEILLFCEGLFSMMMIQNTSQSNEQPPNR